MKPVSLIYYPEHERYCIYIGDNPLGVGLDPEVAVDRFREAVILAKKVSS